MSQAGQSLLPNPCSMSGQPSGAAPGDIPTPSCPQMENPSECDFLLSLDACSAPGVPAHTPAPSWAGTLLPRAWRTSQEQLQTCQDKLSRAQLCHPLSPAKDLTARTGSLPPRSHLGMPVLLPNTPGKVQPSQAAPFPLFSLDLWPGKLSVTPARTLL